jgi:hypothetical protein
VQFKSLFCERFHCPPSEYEERAFKKCLYWHAKLPVWVLHKLAPNFFAKDFKFIRALGEAEAASEARGDADNFRDDNSFNGGMVRTQFRLRVSGRKAMRLAHRLFAYAAHKQRHGPASGGARRVEPPANAGLI